MSDENETLTEEDKIAVYSGIFTNKVAYIKRQVKPHQPIVSKLGIMQKRGTIPAIEGSLNFAMNIDASKPSKSVMYRAPKKYATDNEVEAKPLPKGAKVGRGEYNFDKVFAVRGKDSYTNQDLIYWYEHFTAVRPSKSISRARLEDLHRELDVNKQRK